MIELLVVIAIIAILAAILFPVFAKARDKARQATCTSNMKQIANGILLYLQDYDERMAPWNTAGGPPMWYDKMNPYIGNSKVWRCPADKKYKYDPNGLSYGANGRTLGVTTARMVRPAGIIMLAETNENKKYYDAMVEGAGISETDYYPPGTRHNDGCIVAFWDGHVKWYKQKDIYVITSTGNLVLAPESLKLLWGYSNTGVVPPYYER